LEIKVTNINIQDRAVEVLTVAVENISGSAWLYTEDCSGVVVVRDGIGRITGLLFSSDVVGGRSQQVCVASQHIITSASRIAARMVDGIPDPIIQQVASFTSTEMGIDAMAADTILQVAAFGYVAIDL
jgi:hypothetical protein